MDTIMKTITVLIIFLNLSSEGICQSQFIAKSQKNLFVWRPNPKRDIDWDSNDMCGRIVIFNKPYKRSNFWGTAYEVIWCGKIGFVDSSRINLTEKELLTIDNWDISLREERYISAKRFDSIISNQLVDEYDSEVNKYFEKIKSDSLRVDKELKTILTKNPKKPSRTSKVIGKEVFINQKIGDCRYGTTFTIGESDTAYSTTNKNGMVSVTLDTYKWSPDQEDYVYSIHLESYGNILTENASGISILSAGKLWQFPDNKVDVEMSDGRYIYSSYLSRWNAEATSSIIKRGIDAYKVYIFETKVEPDFKKCLLQLMYLDREIMR
jgi:hypothetical protein